MSSMDNHRRRSCRNCSRKRTTFGNMTRRYYITPTRRKRRRSLKSLFCLLRAALRSLQGGGPV